MIFSFYHILLLRTHVMSSTVEAFGMFEVTVPYTLLHVVFDERKEFLGGMEPKQLNMNTVHTGRRKSKQKFKF